MCPWLQRQDGLKTRHRGLCRRATSRASGAKSSRRQHDLWSSSSRRLARNFTLWSETRRARCSCTSRLIMRDPPPAPCTASVIPYGPRVTKASRPSPPTTLATTASSRAGAWSPTMSAAEHWPSSANVPKSHPRRLRGGLTKESAQGTFLNAGPGDSCFPIGSRRNVGEELGNVKVADQTCESSRCLTRLVHVNWVSPAGLEQLDQSALAARVEDSRE